MIENTCKLKIYSNSAEQGAALSNLTNLGVNTSKFSKEFNEYTKDLPNFILLNIKVLVDDSRSFKFIVTKPSTGSILNLIKFVKKVRIWVFDRYNEVEVYCVKLKDVLQLVRFKFPNLDIKEGFLIVFGTIKSMNLKVVY